MSSRNAFGGFFGGINTNLVSGTVYNLNNNTAFSPLGTPGIPIITTVVNNTSNPDPTGATVTLSAPEYAGLTPITTYTVYYSRSSSVWNNFAQSVSSATTSATFSLPASTELTLGVTPWKFTAVANNAFGAGQVYPGGITTTNFQSTYQQPVFQGRMMVAGGWSGTYSTQVQWNLITTGGSWGNFGALTSGRFALTGCSSTTRAVACGGNTGSRVATMDFGTFATTGNFTSFGSLTAATDYPGAASNTTFGLIGGGFTTASTNKIDVITIASAGNATSYGTMSYTAWGVSGVMSTTRAVFGGGSTTNAMSFCSFASSGSSSSFGTLTVSRGRMGAASNSTRGVWSCGNTGSAGSTTVDYITIASAGNAIAWGSSAATATFNQANSGTASPTWGYFCGGEPSNYTSSLYVNLANTSGYSSGGSLTTSSAAGAGMADSHGGLYA